MKKNLKSNHNKELFKIRGQLTKKTAFTISLSSVVIFFLFWFILSYGGYKITNDVLAELNKSGIKTTTLDTLKPLLNQNFSIRKDFEKALPTDIPKKEKKVITQAASYGKIIPASILPTPIEVLKAIPYLHFEEALVRSIGMSFYRILAGFSLATIVAIPLGILAGTFPFIKACLQPFMGPLRYLPIAAVTGLLIIWFGMGEPMKIMLLFIGIVVYLLPLIVETVENLDDVYLQTAYTLNASRWQIISNVIVPGSMPSIVEALRVMSGIGWTYIILAEIIHAKYGIGHLINIASKRGNIDQVFAGVIIILIIGVLTDKFFVFLQKSLFRWREEN